MPNIKEPEVVYCDRNHIYDKSINDVCPYCAQIEDRNRQIEARGNKGKITWGSFRWKKRGADSDTTRYKERRGQFESDDSTVLKKRGSDDDTTVLKRKDDDDDATVLKRKGDDDDATVLKRKVDDDDATVLKRKVDDDDATVLKKTAAPQAHVSDDGARQAPWSSGNDDLLSPIRIVLPIGGSPSESGQSGLRIRTETGKPDAPEAPVPVRRRRKVIAWLVCTSGEPDYGTSVELWDCGSCISFDADGRIRVQTDSGAEQGCARIWRDETSGIFRIQPVGDGPVIHVDRQKMERSMRLEAGSEIRFGERCFRFFPAVGVCGFEWRQE